MISCFPLDRGSNRIKSSLIKQDDEARHLRRTYSTIKVKQISNKKTPHKGALSNAPIMNSYARFSPATYHGSSFEVVFMCPDPVISKQKSPKEVYSISYEIVST